MQYIPMSQNELLEVPCTVNVCGVDQEITFISLPVCGDNELATMKVVRVVEGDERKRIDVCRSVLDVLCKGYITNGKRVMFENNQKPSDYFNYFFANWFMENMHNFNSLSIEQKKS